MRWRKETTTEAWGTRRGRRKTHSLTGFDPLFLPHFGSPNKCQGTIFQSCRKDARKKSFLAPQARAQQQAMERSQEPTSGTRMHR